MRQFQATLCCVVLTYFAACASAGFVRSGGPCAGGVCPLPVLRALLPVERAIVPPIILEKEKTVMKTVEATVTAEVVRPVAVEQARGRDVFQRIIRIFKRR